MLQRKIETSNNDSLPVGHDFYYNFVPNTEGVKHPAPRVLVVEENKNRSNFGNSHRTPSGSALTSVNMTLAIENTTWPTN